MGHQQVLHILPHRHLIHPPVHHIHQLLQAIHQQVPATLPQVPAILHLHLNIHLLLPSTALHLLIILPPPHPILPPRHHILQPHHHTLHLLPSTRPHLQNIPQLHLTTPQPVQAILQLPPAILHRHLSTPHHPQSTRLPPPSTAQHLPSIPPLHRNIPQPPPSTVQLHQPILQPRPTILQRVQVTLLLLQATPQHLHPMTVMKRRKTRKMSRRARRSDLFSGIYLTVIFIPLVSR